MILKVLGTVMNLEIFDDRQRCKIQQVTGIEPYYIWGTDGFTRHIRINGHKMELTDEFQQKKYSTDSFLGLIVGMNIVDPDNLEHQWTLESEQDIMQMYNELSLLLGLEKADE